MLHKMANNPRKTFWAGIIMGAVSFMLVLIMGFIYKEGTLPAWLAFFINILLVAGVFLIMYAQIFMYERYKNLKLSPLLAFIALIVALLSFFVVVYLIYNSVPRTILWQIVAILIAFIVMSVVMFLFDRISMSGAKEKTEKESGKEIKEEARAVKKKRKK